MSAPKVLNKRKTGVVLDAINIMRPGRWGNPFMIGEHGTRDEVIARYRQWLETRPDLIARARADLRGRDLLCCCAPLACHGDVLLEIANK